MVFVGSFDPISLVFNLMNTLMKKKILSYSEAREVIMNSMPPNMPHEEKKKILNSLLKKTKK